MSTVAKTEKSRKQYAPQPPEWADGGKGLVRIGKITRTHGIAGEVELQFSDDVFDRGDAEYLIFEIDGIFVPFFWEEYRFKNNSAVILRLEDYESDTDAKKLVGLQAYYPIDAFPADAESQIPSMQALTGFQLKDSEGNNLGTIESIDDSTSNTLLYVISEKGKEIVIPYHDDFLLEFDFHKRILQLRIPEGILQLND